MNQKLKLLLMTVVVILTLVVAKWYGQSKEANVLQYESVNSVHGITYDLPVKKTLRD